MKVKGQKWLKGVHIFFACIWIGAGFCLILMQMGLKADDGGTLHGIDVAMKFIDDFIIIPGAFGSLITGLIYSFATAYIPEFSLFILFLPVAIILSIRPHGLFGKKV